MYIHQQKKWPDLHWDQRALFTRITAVRFHQGKLLGRMEGLGFQLREHAELQTLTENIIKTSEIEGEILNRELVRSSVARRLGMDIGGLPNTDRHVEGVVEMMLDATENYNTKLTEGRLFEWHASLFPTGRNNMGKIIVGAWRDDKDGPMQVLSGPMGRQKIHYEAPAARHVAKEMKEFLRWYNQKADIDLIVKAALAHFWYVTVHPFEDGNGRIARAIADMTLARSEGSKQCFYSMSAQIKLERNDYYENLERAQKGSLDITSWVEWFIGCLDRAFSSADATLATVLSKAKFWESVAGQSFNARQSRILNQILDGFEGKLTSSKWAKIAKCSHDTAHRDIMELVRRHILKQDEAGGRSTSYSLVTTAE